MTWSLALGVLAVWGVLCIVVFLQLRKGWRDAAELAEAEARETVLEKQLEGAREFEQTVKEVISEKVSDDPADVIRERLRRRAKGDSTAG